MQTLTPQFWLLLYCAALCTQHSSAMQSFDAPTGPLCVGTEVTINCTVADHGLYLRGTYWTLRKAGNGSLDFCYLAHGVPLDVDDTRCEPFIAELKERSGNLFPSILSARVGLELNNTVIQCSGPNLTNIIGNTTLQIVGTREPAALGIHLDSFVQIPGTSLYNITLQWSLPNPHTSSDNPVLEYVLTVSPPAEPCGNSCMLSVGTRAFTFTERRLSLLLSIDQHYHITLTAQNTDQAGNVCQEIDIQLQVPDLDDSCSSVAYYDQDTSLLTAIENTWNISRSVTEEISAGISALANQYNVTYTTNGGNSWSEVVNASEVCLKGACKHITSLRRNVDNEYYSVQLAAINVIGSGPQVNCTAYPLSAHNDVVYVRAVIGTTYTYINVSIKINFTGIISVWYGTEAPFSQFSHFDTITTNSSAQQEDRYYAIKLTQDPIPNTTYHYKTVVGNVSTTIAVLGSFKIDCSRADLGVSPDSEGHSPRCRDTEGVAMVPGGVACYEGRSVGSHAWYSCDPGYTLGDTAGAFSSRRVCLESGLWSRSTPKCTMSSSSCTVGLFSGETRVVTSIIAVFGFLVGIISASVLFSTAWVRQHCRRQRLTVMGASNPQNSDGAGGGEPSLMEGPQYESVNEALTREVIPLRDNTAYDLTQ